MWKIMYADSDTHAFTKESDRLSDLSKSGLDFVVVCGDSKGSGLFLALELVKNHFIFSSGIVAIVRESVKSEFGHGRRDQS